MRTLQEISGDHFRFSSKHLILSTKSLHISEMCNARYMWFSGPRWKVGVSFSCVCVCVCVYVSYVCALCGVVRYNGKGSYTFVSVFVSSYLYVCVCVCVCRVHECVFFTLSLILHSQLQSDVTQPTQGVVGEKK